MLVAFTGLSGAGKTTAVRLLSKGGRGQPYYAGDLLRRTVLARGLELNPENERLVRAELRENYGMEVFAARAVPEISEQLQSGHVLLDAIYNPEERSLYLAEFPEQLLTVALIANHSLRAERLAMRPERPMSAQDLARRDTFELDTLRLGDVLETADQSIVNEGSLGELEEALNSLIGNLRS